MNETKTLTLGKYAEQRREILETRAPDIYKALLESGSLEPHLTSVQEMAEKYVENYITIYTHSKDYLKAKKNDPTEAMRMLNMTILEAEDTAYRIWVTNSYENEGSEEN